MWAYRIAWSGVLFWNISSREYSCEVVSFENSLFTFGRGRGYQSFGRLLLKK